MLYRRIKILLLNFILLLTCGTIPAQVFTNFSVIDGLPSNNINGVAIDLNNHVWVATDAGVAKFENGVWTVFTTANGLIDNYINCIAVDVANCVWAGTDMGISKYSNGSWMNYNTSSGLVGDMISYICGTPDGDVWVGTNSGVSRFTNNNWINYTSTNGLPGNMISYIKGDNFGNVWIGTWLTGLAKFDGSDFTLFTTNQQLIDNNILSLAIDPSGNKWIGTYMGISVLDSLDQWKINYNHSDGLYNNYIQDLSFDSRSVLWAGIYADYLMDGGISYFYNDRWFSFGVPAGLVDVQVKRIAIDTDDNIWIATGAGLSKLTVNNLSVPELKGSRLTVFPNPAAEKLNIHLTERDTKVKLYDVSGRLYGEYALGTGENSMDISNLKTGVYILKLVDNKNTATAKFIKQ